MKIFVLVAILINCSFINICGRVPQDKLSLKDMSNFDLEKFQKSFEGVFLARAKLKIEDFSTFFEELETKKKDLIKIYEKLYSIVINETEVDKTAVNLVENIKEIIKLNLEHKATSWSYPSDKALNSYDELVAAYFTQDLKEVEFVKKKNSENVKGDEKTSDKIIKDTKSLIGKEIEFYSAKQTFKFKSTSTSIRKRKRATIKKAKTKLANINYARDVNSIRPNDQGRCGSCWAFSEAYLLTLKYNLDNRNNQITMLSPQFIMDCLNDQYVGTFGLCRLCWMTNGCNPKWKYEVPRGMIAMFTHNVHFPLHTNYPYLNSLLLDANSNNGRGRLNPDNCRDNKDNNDNKAFNYNHIIYYSNHPLNPFNPTKENFHANLANNGPAIVSIAINFVPQNVRSLIFYGGGVISDFSCNTGLITAIRVNHATVLVGYTESKTIPNLDGTTRDIPVWLIRNSWQRHESFIFLSAEGNGNTCDIYHHAYTYNNQ